MINLFIIEAPNFLHSGIQICSEKKNEKTSQKKIIVLIKQFSSLNDAAASLILITLWHSLPFLECNDNKTF